MFWLKKTFTSESYDVVVAGDSRIYRGVSPDDLLMPLGNGVDAINLGYSSAGFDKKYRSFILSKLDKKGKVKTVVVGLTPHCFTPDALENGHFHEIRATTNADLLTILYLEPILKFFEPRKIKAIFKLNFNHPSNSLEKFHNNGWAESDNLKGDSLAALKNYSKVFVDNTVNEEAVNEFMVWIDSVSNAGIQVIGFRPPTTPQMRALEDSLSGFDEEKVRQQFESNGGYWMDVKDEDYSSYDGSHLRSSASRKLSREIGEVIKRL